MIISSSLEALCARALPEVTRLAAVAEIREIMGRVGALGGSLPEAVARVAASVGQERERALRRIDADTQTLRAAGASGRGEAAVTELLDREGSAADRRADRQAMGRWLDASALEDRLLRGRHRMDQQWELIACLAAEVSLTEVSAQVRDELTRLVLRNVADRTIRWPVRVATAKLLGALARSAPLEARGRVELDDALEELAHDVSDDPWVVDAALTTALQDVTPEAAQSLLSAALRTEGAHRDHRFLRARVARHAAAQGRWGLVRELLDDPSEHVAMAAVEALAASTRVTDREHVAALLRGPEASWRVAARGALALIDRGHLELVGTRISGARSWRAARVVLDGLWQRVRADVLGPNLAARVREAWSPALDVWVRSSEADVQRLADVLATWARGAEQPGFLAALEVLRADVTATSEGDTRAYPTGPVAACSSDMLLDLLYLLAQDDVDLSADPLGTPDLVEGTTVPAGGWRVYVGLRSRRAAWRVLHEARHPRHDKRQAWHHTVDALPPGKLVAWSAHMAEVVATTVPGRRVSSPTTLAWKEHLPLPANLIATGRQGVRLRVTAGQITLRPTTARARWSAHRHYVALSDLRERLGAQPPAEATPAWDRALTEEGFEVRRTGMSAVWPGLGWLGAVGASDASTAVQLGIISAASMGTWTLQKLLAERRVTRDRKAIPLVVGGWGSRGKSSVERLKGALFHGLGFTVLCKSTGCEAMVLVAIPGAEAAEVFLYRPRDKATIVENHTVLRLAANLKAQVMLWECMALNPAYTQLLQLEWMRDDLSTVTNTYPDHEDIQGPSGRDVADVISEFTPRKGRLVSSEQQMAPVLARRALERGSTFVGCRHEDWDLIPRDLIDRFPYREYDRNVALVAALAKQLGVPQDVAIRTMADHVLTDLGAFKVYGPVDVEGRRLSYAAGNSANDRASFLSNWERMDLDTFGPRAGLDQWLVLVINNRGDRLARQAVFARIAALDMSAERIVVIGTNVGPCTDAILSDLRQELRPRWLELGHGADGRRRLFERFCARLRRRPMTQDAADAVIADTWAGTEDPERQAAARAWCEEVTWLHGLQGDWPIDAAIDQGIVFLARRVMPLLDPKVSGDTILTTIGRAMPSGAEATLLGCANIKGTGLDLVYRWVSVDRVLGWLRSLEDGEASQVREALERISAYDGWGLFDARAAASSLSALRDGGRFSRLGLDDDAEAALASVERARRGREALRDAGSVSAPSWTDSLRAFTASVDIVGSTRRRHRADRLYEDLGRGRVGLARAAVEAKHLVDGEKN